MEEKQVKRGRPAKAVEVINDIDANSMEKVVSMPDEYQKDATVTLEVVEEKESICKENLQVQNQVVKENLTTKKVILNRNGINDLVNGGKFIRGEVYELEISRAEKIINNGWGIYFEK